VSTVYRQTTTIVATTQYEAKIKAELAYGKDGFEVVEKRKVERPLMLGFGTETVWELTIAVNKERLSDVFVQERNDVPKRPVISREITPGTKISPSSLIGRPSSLPSSSFSIDIDEPVVVPNYAARHAGAQTYKNVSNLSESRAVNALRSIQDGEDDPKPSKQAVKLIESDKFTNIIDELIGCKEMDKPFDVSGQDAADSETSRILMNEIASLKKMLSKIVQGSGTMLQEPLGVASVRNCLEHIGVPNNVIEHVLKEALDGAGKEILDVPLKVFKLIEAWLNKNLSFISDSLNDSSVKPKIITLMGPTGVGKTTTIGKIVGRYRLTPGRQRSSVAVFTLDTYRIGASDQLETYADIFDAELEVLYKPEELEEAVKKHKDKDLIVVDTAGRCQKATKELQELKLFLDKIPLSTRYLALSSTSKYDDMLDVVKCFDKVGFDRLIFTKVDETNTVGSLLALMLKTGKPLGYITNGQTVPDHFQAAQPDFFTSWLML